VPTRGVRDAAEGLGRVDGAEDEDTGRRAEHVGEEAAPVELDDPTPAAADELDRLRDDRFRRRSHRLTGLEDEHLAASVELGENDRALLGLGDPGQPFEELRCRRGNVDVDLAAAGQSDLQRLVVRDPVREQARRRPGQDLACAAVHLVLDAAAGHGPGHLAGLRHQELRPDRPRRRAAGGDNGRNRDPVPTPAPAFEIGKKLSHRPILAGLEPADGRG
jgi:hypothetical protein